MKVLVIGATGTIGKAVVKALVARHQVVSAGHRQGEFRVDLAEPASIEELFGSVGPVDAVVSAAGAARFGPLANLTDQDFRVGLLNKLLGQINLTRIAARTLTSGGSVTLTAGLASRHFVPGIVPLSVVNAGLEAFVRAAVLEIPRHIRLNVVSPGWVAETRLAYGMDPSPGTPAAEVALAYVRSVEGTETGTVLDVGRFP